MVGSVHEENVSQYSNKAKSRIISLKKRESVLHRIYKSVSLEGMARRVHTERSAKPLRHDMSHGSG